MNSADTSWIIVATALVLLMTLPGLALFYGGLVRSKNVLSVFIHNYLIACLMSVLWLAFGYSIAFGSSNSFWGGFEKVFLIGIDQNTLAGTIPEILFFAFQMTFAIITPALIVGAYVERVSLSFVILFSSLWMLIVYSPVVHWVWGGGLLSNGSLFEKPVMDFAGGIVVHETAGIAALTIAFFLGKREETSKPPHNPGMVMIGAALLWVGWFGFNGGSVLSADPTLTSLTLVTTSLAAAAGGVSAAFFSNLLYKNFDLTMFMNGVLGGLVGITAGADQMSPTDAIIIGLIAGIIIVLGVALIDKLKLDDPVGAVAVHLICGIWGTLAVGLFGALAGSEQLIAQLIGIGVIGLTCIISSFTLLFVVKIILGGLRVSKEEELNGLDISEHGMDAYADFSLNKS